MPIHNAIIYCCKIPIFSLYNNIFFLRNHFPGIRSDIRKISDIRFEETAFSDIRFEKIAFSDIRPDVTFCPDIQYPLSGNFMIRCIPNFQDFTYCYR